ncbi:MAG: hypothetical protein DHS20C11_12310 [Lysobacteraceae bacterium]|nr:MAG: hypothetical protein DHS20C11_12310 [Xanthomonadaceae bacterium]
MKRWVIALATVLILGVSNYSIYQRETLVNDGHTLLLRLAPVDPRSLMQGDYMALRFTAALEAQAHTALDQLPSDGHLLLALDANKVGQFVGFADQTPRQENQLLMRYRIRNGRFKFASNAFFFEEGSADLYQQAQYGEFRVDDHGEAILVAMRNADLTVVGAQQ